VRVLDECDEMLSMGFQEDIEAILERTPAERQTLLFSATVPDGIQRLSRASCGTRST
jgi:ATP-dependent RNA helicase DeaD